MSKNNHGAHKAHRLPRTVPCRGALSGDSTRHQMPGGTKATQVRHSLGEGECLSRYLPGFPSFWPRDERRRPQAPTLENPDYSCKTFIIRLITKSLALVIIPRISCHSFRF